MPTISSFYYHQFGYMPTRQELLISPYSVAHFDGINHASQNWWSIKGITKVMLLIFSSNSAAVGNYLGTSETTKDLCPSLRASFNL